MTLRWKVVREGALEAAGYLLILLVHACTEDPTGVAKDPSFVVRGYDNGCVPEVIEGTTDSTKTSLVTFTAPGFVSCLPNLVPWGIDMADPVPVDTPQGDGFFRIETDLNLFTNAPSPGYAAHGANYTPPQVMIEFDPPIYTTS